MVRCMEKRSMFPGVAAMKHTYSVDVNGIITSSLGIKSLTAVSISAWNCTEVSRSNTLLLNNFTLLSLEVKQIYVPPYQV